MEIRFTRSGGFAGRATEVSGVIDFTPSGAHVSVDGTTYKHELLQPEATQLRETATAKLSAPLCPPPANHVRDGYHYDATIVTEDGKQHCLTFDPCEQPESASANLTGWIEQETQKIWEFRLANRQKKTASSSSTE